MEVFLPIKLDGDGNHTPWTKDMRIANIRRSFFIQCPLMILAGILVAWRLPSETRKVKVNAKNADKSPLARLDLLGAALLASTIVTFLLALNVLGAAQSSGTPLALALVFGTILSGFGFVRVERRRGDGAIYPLRLFHYREVLTAYCMACFQYSAQYSVSAQLLFTVWKLTTQSPSSFSRYLLISR